jgi:phosphohistidine phosphatase
LVVVRHAKSAWPYGVADQERPLAPRGRLDAPRIGRWIQGNVGRVDFVVLSPAVRVAQTWELIAGELGHGQVVADSRVYQAWGWHLLDVVKELPEQAATALVVGHEPGVSELTLTLANSSNHVLRRRISHKYPTCAVAVLSSARAWDQFTPGCADLADFVVPKDF